MSDLNKNYGIKMTADASGVVGASQEAAKAQGALSEQLGKTGAASKSAAEESKRFVDRLKDEAETLGKSRTEVERYRAGQLALTDAQKKSVEASLASIQAHERNQRALENVRTAATTATAAVVAYATAKLLAIKSAVDEADHLNKLSQQLGLSTEALSGYGYAAKLADVSNEEFAQSMKLLSKNISEARGGVGDGAQLFRLLGKDVSAAVKSGADLEQLLPLLAEQFSQFADGPNKTALAMALMGRAGEQMIPLFNSGKRGLEELRAEAERFGIVIGGEFARRAEEFNDNVTRITTSLTSFKYGIANDALPWLNKMVEQLLEGSRIAGGFGSALLKFGTMMPGNSGSQIEGYRTQISQLQAGREQLAGLGGYDATLVSIDNQIKTAQQRIQFLQYLQRQDALSNASQMGDVSDQNTRMFMSGGRKQAPALPKTGETKISDFQNYKAEIGALNETLDQQAQQTDELTQADRKWVEVMASVGAGTKKLTVDQIAEINTLLNAASIKEKNLRARELQKKADEESAKAYEQYLGQLDKSIERQEDENKKLLEHAETVGLNTEQLGRYKVAQQEAAVASAETALSQARGNEATAQEISRLERLVELKKQNVVITRQDAQANVAAEASKKQLEEFKRTQENIERGLSDAVANALMDGFDKGKSIGQNFLDAMKNMFKTAILQPIIQPILRPIANMAAGAVQGVTSSLFGSAGTSAAGSFLGGNVGSLGSMLGGAQTIADFGNFFGSVGATTEMGTTFGMMDAISGFAAANPWAAAAIAAAAIIGGSSLFGDDDKPLNPQIGLRFNQDQAYWGRPEGGFHATWGLPGGTSDDVAKVTSIYGSLNDPTKYDQNVLKSLIGTTITGNPGDSTDMMLQRFVQALEPARIAAEQTQQAEAARQAALTQQRTQLDISLMDAQGRAAEALAARRKLELDAADESLRPMMLQIYASQDATKAAQDAAKAQDELTRAQQDSANAAARLVGEQASVTGSLRSVVLGLPRELGIESLQQGVNALSTSEFGAPLDRLSGARGIFDRTLASARGGDLGAIGALPDAVQSLLGIGRDVYASGPDFQSLFLEANRALSEVLAQQQSVQRDILSSVPLTLQETSRDQIGAIREQTVQLSAKLDSIALEMRRLKVA